LQQVNRSPLRAALAACGAVSDVLVNGWHARRILPAAPTPGQDYRQMRRCGEEG
jgi:hypothetical protein